MRQLFMALALLPATIFVFTACSEPEETEQSTVDTDAYIHRGDSLSMLAQQALLMKVSHGLQTEGPAATLEFCHENASPIIDSLSEVFGVHIGRISSQNRNPKNAATSEEEMLLARFAAGLKDTFVINNDVKTYYKAIHIGMPACLLCHGVPETDIQPATLEKIREHYPNDKATGYHSGELRGAWKIVFED